MTLKIFSSRVFFEYLKRVLVPTYQPLRQRNASVSVAGWRSARSYHNIGRPKYRGPGSAATIRVVDLRSDAFSRPGPAMRRAMLKAMFDEDLMREEETVDGKSKSN